MQCAATVLLSGISEEDLSLSPQSQGCKKLRATLNTANLFNPQIYNVLSPEGLILAVYLLGIRACGSPICLIKKESKSEKTLYLPVNIL
jgi:hypothetical protein